MLRLTPFLLAASAASAFAAAPAPIPVAPLPGGPDAWQLVWQDEFDYPDAELDERWVSQNSPSTHILSSRWRENAVVRDGTLRLINRKEERGGQQWTSGNIWTKERFQYGYFEARYRYAAAEGTNNSFWLMTNTPGEPAVGKRFEIDINEGHYPNEVNTNIHNWSDITIHPDGRRTHPSASKSFTFGVKPDVTVQLEIPVRASRVRLRSTHDAHFHIREFRIFDVSPSGYPDALSTAANAPAPGLVNHARSPDTEITVSGFHQEGTDTRASLVDGDVSTSWISQTSGPKFVEFVFPSPRQIGCIQFIHGWQKDDAWQGLLQNYHLEYHDGKTWVPMAAFDVKDSGYNMARDFHVYGLSWTPEELVFYFNDREIRREKNAFAHSPAPIWLSLAIIRWAGPVTDAIDGTFMEVDYVRVYQPR